MRTLFCTLFIVALTLSSQAQDSRADVSVGYSLAHAEFDAGSTNLNGFDIEYTVKPRFRAQRFGIVTHFSQYFGSAPVPLAGFATFQAALPKRQFQCEDVQSSVGTAFHGNPREAVSVRESFDRWLFGVCKRDWHLSRSQPVGREFLVSGWSGRELSPFPQAWVEVRRRPFPDTFLGKVPN